jgi:hypothetical protein
MSYGPVYGFPLYLRENQYGRVFYLLPCNDLEFSFWLFLYAISRVFYVLLYSDVESLYLNAIEYLYLLSYSDVESLCFEYDRVFLSPIL